MAAGINKVLESLSINLAFAAPAPYGPIAAAGLGGLFGVLDLFGGSGSDPFEKIVDAIRTMISEAVEELEGYMRQLNIEKAEGDVVAFFQWYQLKIAGQTTAPIVQADITLIEGDPAHGVTGILEELETAHSFLSGSLLNNLVSFSTDNYVNPSSSVATRDEDAILSVLMATMTALIAASKLQIRLHAACAAFYAPDDAFGKCQDAAADKAFQVHVEAWAAGIEGLKSLIGDQRGRLPSTLLPTDTFVNGPWWGDFDSTDVYSGPAKCIATTYRQLLRPPLVMPLPWDTTVSIPPPSSFPPFSLSSLGPSGWGAALETLAMWRVLRRIGQIIIKNDYVKSIPGNFNFFQVLDGATQIDLGGADFQFDSAKVHVDSPAGDYSHACAAAASAVDTFLSSQKPGQANATTWFDDIRIVEGWHDGLQQILKMIPPERPGNTAVIHAWSNGPPDSASEWAKADHVCYAFAFRVDNTFPRRTEFGSPIEIRAAGVPRWKPDIHAIPSNPAPGGQTEIWRQFIHGDDRRLPRIVAIVPGSTTQFVDTDLGLD